MKHIYMRDSEEIIFKKNPQKHKDQISVALDSTTVKLNTRDHPREAITWSL